jgi:hypothetical protein
MTYTVDSNFILVELDRTTIVDISAGDTIEVASIGATYTWAEQDMQFLESNPDARIFLKFEKAEDKKFNGHGLAVMPQEVY